MTRTSSQPGSADTSGFAPDPKLDQWVLLNVSQLKAD